MSTAHLLKVTVQPVFVAITDDGAALEQPSEPMTIAGRDWATFVAPDGPLDGMLQRAMEQITGKNHEENTGPVM